MNWELELKKQLQKRDIGLETEQERIKVYIFDDMIGQHITKYITSNSSCDDELCELVVITGSAMMKELQLDGCPTVRSMDEQQFHGIDGIIKLREHCDSMFNRHSLQFSPDTPETALLAMILPVQNCDTNKKETRYMPTITLTNRRHTRRSNPTSQNAKATQTTPPRVETNIMV